MQSLTRRQMLSASLAGTLAACYRPVKVQLPVTCSGTLRAPAPPLFNELTVDAHCHIFNGTDLQAAAFLKKVVLREKGINPVIVTVLSDLLQDAAWNLSPDGKEEKTVVAALLACKDQMESARMLAVHRNAGYERGRTALLSSPDMKSSPKQNAPARALRETGEISRESVLAELKARLPPTREEYVRGKQQARARIRTQDSGLKAAIAEQSLTGALDYVLQNFNYRYVNVYDYLDTFNQNGGRQIDLMLASMVDYDWWLAQGKKTRTSLQEQVEVMEQISVLTRGRVHGFVPFDPLREVAFRSKQREAGYSSLALVQDAVMNRGFPGVKLYPPMGFAAYGNGDMHPNFWKREGLPEWMQHPIEIPGSRGPDDIGSRLDEALADLYRWAVDKEVPLMAHASLSNGPADDFAALAGPEHWKRALCSFPDIQISFGHFGDFPYHLDSGSMQPQAFEFAELMNAHGGAYADTGYFSEVLNQATALAHQIETAYGTSGSVLASRLMYGSDWSLLMNQGNVDQYLAQFVQAFEDVDTKYPAEQGRKMSQRFFGWNAMDWVGFAKNAQALARLTNFYSAHQIDVQVSPPDWMQKLKAGAPSETL